MKILKLIPLLFILGCTEIKKKEVLSNTLEHVGNFDDGRKLYRRVEWISGAVRETRLEYVYYRSDEIIIIDKCEK